MRGSDERGFTLVEVTVSLLIFTIGIVGLAQLMAVSLQMQAHGRNQTSAVRLAQDKLDQLMSLQFASAPQVQITGSDSLSSNVVNFFDNDVQGYTRRWRVEAGPDPNANLRQITIRVIPDLRDRRTATPYQLVSIIRRW